MSVPAAVAQETRAIRPCRIFKGHADWVRGIIHLPGRQRITTCSDDGSLRVWDLQTGKQIGNDWWDGGGGINTIASFADGKKVASGSDDGAVRLWDVDTGKVIAEWTGHAGHVYSVCRNADGGRVVSGCGDGTVMVWEVESGKTVLVIETGLSIVYAVIYSPDTTMIATSGGTGEENLKIWDAKTGKLVENLKGHTSAVRCLAWTADGKTLISGSYDYSTRTWNTTTWQQITVLTGHTGTVWGIAISLNGRILASASQDNTARLWNLDDGQPIGSPLQHDDSVHCVSFSADGKLLATGCDDDNAYSWDISAIAKEAGFSDLLNPNNKSDPTATRRRGDWRRNPYPGPSNDSPHPHLAGRHILSPSSAHHQHISAHVSSHLRIPPGRISSPSRGNNDNAGSLPTQLRFIEWVRNHLSTTQNTRHEGIELPERCTEVVNVPLTRGKPRIYSRREVEMKQEKEEEKKAAMKKKKKQKARDAKDAKDTKNVSAGSSPPSQRIVTRQPGEEAQTPPIPVSHYIDVPPSPTTSVIAANSAGVAHWTWFWSAVCCTSTQNADGDH